MPLVYSYLRFSDPKQAAGSSADRQTEYAQRWAAARGLVLDLWEGVEALDTEARMRARELVRASFSRIRIWHSGEPAVEKGILDMELTARGVGTMRILVDRATGGLID